MRTSRLPWGCFRRSKAHGRAQAAARLPLVRVAGDAGAQKDSFVTSTVFWAFLRYSGDGSVASANTKELNIDHMVCSADIYMVE